MWAEIQQATAASVQVQLMTARLTLQEFRLTTLRTNETPCTLRWRTWR